MAGRGLCTSEFRLSIMQSLRFNALRWVRDASASGTSVKRLLDRSRDCKVAATGARLETLRSCIPFSARLRWRKNLHLDEGK